MPKQLLRKRLVPLLLTGAFFFGCFICYLTTLLTGGEDAAFEDFTHRIFCEQVSSNALNLHYTLADPETYDIEPPALTFGSLSREAFDEGHLYLENQQTALEQFDTSELSDDNRLTWDILSQYLRTELSNDNQYIMGELLSPGLGIQAQLPVLLAEYTFRNESDIQDYLQLLAQVDHYFAEILSFEQAKSSQGYFMNDTTLDGIISQCNTFLSDGNDNYLARIFHRKLQDFPKLSTEQRDIYENEHAQILTLHVLPAYTQLVEGLELLRGTGTNQNGLYYYSNGQQYYTWLLQRTTGVYDSIPVIEKRLLGQLQQDQQSMYQLLQKYPNLTSQSLSLGQNAFSAEPEEMLDELQEKMTDDFPSAPSISYDIKYVDEDLQKHLSPAFYLTPPLDTLSPNTIYINPASSLTGLDLYTTLGHEGFPGHLYQTQYFAHTNPDPVRHLMGMGGYIEGWATYVESFAYRYADCDPAVSTAAWLNRSLNLCLFSICDVGIHYRGWTQAQTGSFLANFGITDQQAVSNVFHSILADPANYLKYYLGYLSFLDIRTRAETAAGDNFDMKKFHKNVLEIGPSQFPVLQKWLESM